MYKCCCCQHGVLKIPHIAFSWIAVKVCTSVCFKQVFCFNDFFFFERLDGLYAGEYNGS